MSRICILKILSYCMLATVIVCTSASSSECIVESEHPYVNNFKHTWSEIGEPGATEIRIHFEVLDLSDMDKLIIYDEYGNVVETHQSDLFPQKGVLLRDYWTEWYVGDSLGVKLVTNDQGVDHGFKIDNVDFRTDTCLSKDLPESYHPYANNFDYRWPAISEPGATEIRIHFEILDLNDMDKLIIYDEYGNVLEIHQSDFFPQKGVLLKDYWTDWYEGDTLEVRLITNGEGNDYGFKIDEGEIRTADNVTTVFYGAPNKGTDLRDVRGNGLITIISEIPQNFTFYLNSIYEQILEIGVSVNVSEPGDHQPLTTSEWIVENIKWIFSGVGISLIAYWKKMKKKE